MESRTAGCLESRRSPRTTGSPLSLRAVARPTTSAATFWRCRRGRDLYGGSAARRGTSSPAQEEASGPTCRPSASVAERRIAAVISRAGRGVPRGSSPVPGRGFVEYLPGADREKDGREIRACESRRPVHDAGQDLGKCSTPRKSDVKAIREGVRQERDAELSRRLSDPKPTIWFVPFKPEGGL